MMPLERMTVGEIKHNLSRITQKVVNHMPCSNEECKFLIQIIVAMGQKQSESKGKILTQ